MDIENEASTWMHVQWKIMRKSNIKFQFSSCLFCLVGRLTITFICPHITFILCGHSLSATYNFNFSHGSCHALNWICLACRPHQIQLYPFVNFNWQTNTKNDFGWENKINFNNLFLVMWVNNCNKIIHLQNKCAVGIREFNKLSMRKLLWFQIFHAIDFVDFFFLPPFWAHHAKWSFITEISAKFNGYVQFLNYRTTKLVFKFH